MNGERRESKLNLCPVDSMQVCAKAGNLWGLIGVGGSCGFLLCSAFHLHLLPLLLQHQKDLDRGYNSVN